MSAGAVRGDLEDTPVITWGPEDAEAAIEALKWALSADIEFGIDGYGRWVALWRDGSAGLICNGPDELAAAVRARYAQRAGSNG